MRTRPIAALSLAAVAALLLVGCSSGGAEPDATSTDAAAADLCGSAAPTGPLSDAVTVDGEFGSAPTATFDAPLEIDEVQRTVVSDGSDEALEEGDYIAYALTAYDASTGESLGSLGYGEGEILPQTITADSVLGSFFGCAPVGSRVVTTLPASEEAGSPAAVYVLDLLSVTPTQAWGEDQAPAEGLPVVELADDGEPTITIPDGDAPTELQMSTLKLGDGPTVAAGDNVLVQYKGVLWADGEEFDSSWSRDEPSQFATTGVVDGFRQALEGQTVGSQVVVVIPPALGYGDAETNGIPGGSTLVFVVDILATQHAAAAAE